MTEGESPLWSLLEATRSRRQLHEVEAGIAQSRSSDRSQDNEREEYKDECRDEYPDATEDNSDSSDDFDTVDLASVGGVDWDCLDDSRHSRRRHNRRIA